MQFQQIFPTDTWQLVLLLDDGSIYKIDYSDLEPEFAFCAFPNRLKAFTFTEREITWKNGVKLTLEKAMTLAVRVELSEVERSRLNVGMKNQAPTEEHPGHHVYSVYLHPLHPTEPIVLEESIGGGIGDSGGGRSCSFEELVQLPYWKAHFEFADCAWAIPLIEAQAENWEVLVAHIAEEVRLRSSFD